MNFLEDALHRLSDNKDSTEKQLEQILIKDSWKEQYITIEFCEDETAKQKKRQAGGQPRPNSAKLELGVVVV